MNKRNFLILSILALVAVLAAGVVIAQPHGGRGGRGPGMMAGGHGPGGGPGGPFGRLGRLKSELGLSDEQVEKIKGIFEDLRDQNESYRDQLREGRGDAAKVLVANPNDIAGSQALVDKQLSTERALRTNMITATSKAMKVLTAEQRAKLAEIMSKREERRAERMEHRGDRRR